MYGLYGTVLHFLIHVVVFCLFFFSFSLFLLFERLAVFLSQNRSQYHGIYNMRTVAILYSKVHQYSTVTISCKYHISAIIVSDKNTFSIQLS